MRFGGASSGIHKDSIYNSNSTSQFFQQSESKLLQEKSFMSSGTSSILLPPEGVDEEQLLHGDPTTSLLSLHQIQNEDEAGPRNYRNRQQVVGGAGPINQNQQQHVFETRHNKAPRGLALGVGNKSCQSVGIINRATLKTPTSYTICPLTFAVIDYYNDCAEHN